MWIGARILVVLTALVARWRLRGRQVQPTGRTWGVAYSITEEKNGKDGRTTIGVPLESRVLFRLGEEDRYAKFFRLFGLTPEMRTGDRTFDARYTVVADHRFLGQLLREERALRSALLDLAHQGAEAVYGDGRILWVRFSKKVVADKFFPEMVALKRMLSPLEKSVPSRFRDVSLWKAFTAEVLLFGTLCYGAVSCLVEWLDVRSLYLMPTAMVVPALAAGFAIVAILFLITFLLTLRTPRTAAIRGEALVLGILILPFAGYGAASQCNRLFDRSAAVQTTAEIAHKERSRQDGKFYLHLKKHRAPASLEAAMPPRIEVPPGLFRQAKAGGKVKFTIGHGRLGVDWIRTIRVP